MLPFFSKCRNFNNFLLCVCNFCIFFLFCLIVDLKLNFFLTTFWKLSATKTTPVYLVNCCLSLAFICINDITILGYTLYVFLLLSMQGILNRHLPDTNTLTITHSYARIGGLVQFTAVKISIKRCLYILQWQESKPPWCTIARSAFFLIFKFAIPKIVRLFSIPD